jgi:hypothetical protein
MLASTCPSKPLATAPIRTSPRVGTGEPGPSIDLQLDPATVRPFAVGQDGELANQTGEAAMTVRAMVDPEVALARSASSSSAGVGASTRGTCRTGCASRTCGARRARCTSSARCTSRTRCAAPASHTSRATATRHAAGARATCATAARCTCSATATSSRTAGAPIFAIVTAGCCRRETQRTDQYQTPMIKTDTCHRAVIYTDRSQCKIFLPG